LASNPPRRLADIFAGAENSIEVDLAAHIAYRAASLVYLDRFFGLFCANRLA
jgi:hypothetical protein